VSEYRIQLSHSRWTAEYETDEEFFWLVVCVGWPDETALWKKIEGQWHQYCGNVSGEADLWRLPRNQER